MKMRCALPFPDRRSDNRRCLRRWNLAAALSASLATGDAFAQAAVTKSTNGQPAKKDDPWPINDSVDDPAIWGKAFPLHYELYRDRRHGAHEARRQRGLPSDADPGRSALGRLEVKGRRGYRSPTMWQD